jgi:hypothetical protein
MSGPDKSTISSSELSMLLLGSSAALPITGNGEASKEWPKVIGKSRQSGPLSWERSGRGLNTVEASQLLKQQSMGAVHDKGLSKTTTRYRKLEGKGGREGVVQNYHLLLNDLSQRGESSENKQGNDVRDEKKELVLPSSNLELSSPSVQEDQSSSYSDQRRELRKRPRTNSKTSDRSTCSSQEDDSSFSSRLDNKLLHHMREDDSDSDEIDARRNRARSKAMQRRAEASIHDSDVRQDSDPHSMESISGRISGKKEEDHAEFQVSDSDGSDSDTDSSSTTSSSSSFADVKTFSTNQSLKPVFIPKSRRLVSVENTMKEKGK